MSDSIANPLLASVAGEVEEDTLYMCGYLHKEARNGKWQKRWFETNGPYLTYYKTSQMEKLLAALSIPQVGAIRRLPSRPGEPGVLFSLELLDRAYVLRAATEGEADRWIEVLEGIRSAVQAEAGAQTKQSNSRLSSVDHSVVTAAAIRESRQQNQMMLPQLLESRESDMSDSAAVDLDPEPAQASPSSTTTKALSPKSHTQPTVTVTRVTESPRLASPANGHRSTSSQSDSRTISSLSVDRWQSVDLRGTRTQSSSQHRSASTTWDKSHRSCCGCF